MNLSKIKKLGCKECPHYCEPREGYPIGTCLEVQSYQHGLDKIEECPLVEQALIEIVDKTHIEATDSRYTNSAS